MSEKILDSKDFSALPFRPGVGMMIVDKNQRVFVGKRVDSKANGWQMPQGGIDLGETPSAAALREMEEEIEQERAAGAFDDDSDTSF